eukprot:10474151-Alexandrium_andersonii.AAC.1
MSTCFTRGARRACQDKMPQHAIARMVFTSRGTPLAAPWRSLVRLLAVSGAPLRPGSAEHPSSLPH